MLSRTGFLAVLVLGVAAFIVVACQSLPLTKALPTADNSPVASTSAPANPMTADSVVWGKIPYCTCLSGIATANVSTALDKAHLSGTVKEHYPTGGWMYFVVNFDPKAASRDQIVAAIAAGGGTVLDGPP